MNGQVLQDHLLSTLSLSDWPSRYKELHRRGPALNFSYGSFTFKWMFSAHILNLEEKKRTKNKTCHKEGLANIFMLFLNTGLPFLISGKSVLGVVVNVKCV